MRISLWHHGKRRAPTAPTPDPIPRRKTNDRRPVVTSKEDHWILVDGPVYRRLERMAERHNVSVVKLLDSAIHRALDAIYLEKAGK